MFTKGCNKYTLNVKIKAVPDPANPAGSRVTLGGAAYLSTLVKTLKAQNPQRTLVVAADRAS